MATSSVTANSMNQMLAGYARNLGFSEVRMEQDIGTNISILMVKYPDGTTAATHFVAGAPPQAIISALKKMAKNKANVLDMRMNAVESMDDFLSLLNRAKEQARQVDSVMLTPDQVQTLEIEGVSTLYGCNVIVDGTPNASY
jgi:hypothetical protein